MGVLKKPTPEEMTELQRMGSNPTIVRYLQSSLDQTKDSLIATPDIDTVRQLQGQAQLLNQLLRFIKQ